METDNYSLLSELPEEASLTEEEPRGWGVANPDRRGGGVNGRRWLGCTAASHSDGVRPVSRDAAQGGAAGSRQLDGKDPAQRKGRKPS